MKISPCLTSHRQNWKTPKMFYKELDKEFNFDFDPCPPDPSFDGLSADWGKRVFCNPPYNEIKKWVAKAWLSVHGAFNADDIPTSELVVMLIPSRTDTKWWHEYCMKADEIRFIKGRLKFDDKKWNAPFPSAVIVFKQTEETKKLLKEHNEIKGGGKSELQLF